MPSPNVNPHMEYRRLGASGLRVSVLSFGSWVTFGNQLDTGLARDCIDAAGEAGCNFFDNAEVYAGGESETIMGRVFQELGVPPVSGIEEVVLAVDLDHRRSLHHVALPGLIVAKEFDSRSGEFGAVGGQGLGEDHGRDATAVAVGLPQQPQRSVVVGHRARVDRTTQVEGAHERFG